MWTFAPALGFNSTIAKPFAPVRPNRIIRDLHGLPPVLARAGDLELRLATTKQDIRKAQRLRYKVFFEEGGAVAEPRAALTRRDICRFDRICDHLIVIDTTARTAMGRPKLKVVGTYRLLRREVADAHGGFYSHAEFDLGPLLARHPETRFLELGRSCVHAGYRSKRVIELLWRGLWTYARHHRIDAMIGCASLPGTNPLAHAAALSFLHHHAAASEEWRVTPQPGRAVPMNLIEAKALSPHRAAAGLPPLLKAYVRVGSRFGDGAVIDAHFGTIDVFTLMVVADIEARYVAHFGDASWAETEVA
jgi:putative hemolysin